MNNHPNRQVNGDTNQQVNLESHQREVMSDHGMDGLTRETTREALVACGVKGPNLDRLARETALSPGRVHSTYAEIESDPNVRSTSAVLVRRLATELGIELKGGSIKAISHDFAREIEQIRRNRGLQ